MGSYEAPVNRQVVNEIVLTDTSTISGVWLTKISGRLLMSGNKLYIDDGSALNLITSA